MRLSSYICFILLPVLIATGEPEGATRAHGGLTTPELQVPRDRTTLQPQVQRGQLAPQTLEEGEQSNPRASTSQMKSDQFQPEPEAHVQPDPEPEARGANKPQSEVKNGITSLTRMDLSKLPLDNNTYALPRPSKFNTLS